MAYEWYDFDEREDGLRTRRTITRYIVQPLKPIQTGVDPHGNINSWSWWVKISKREARDIFKNGYYKLQSRTWNSAKGHYEAIEIIVEKEHLKLYREEEVLTKHQYGLNPDDVVAPKRKKK